MGERWIGGKIGPHPMMDAAMQNDLLQRGPPQATKKRNVLALHMGQERPAAARMRRRDGETYQSRAQCADAAIIGGDCQARSPPEARLWLMDAHRPDDVIRRNTQQRDGHDGDRNPVNVVTVISAKQALFLAEHLLAQRGRATPFPGLGRAFDLELAGNEWL